MENQNEEELEFDNLDIVIASPQSVGSTISLDSESSDDTELCIQDDAKPDEVATCGKVKSECDSDSDSEGQGCPICFEPWSNSGPHRLASLKCGHLFGRSCIERWLKGKSTDKCPQCNTLARRKDIRNIYCKTLKAIDTTEQDRALKELEEEKMKRSKAEEEHMRTKIQFEMARAELQRLREQFKQASSMQQQKLAAVNERLTSAEASCAVANKVVHKKMFFHQKSIQIAQSKARVMAFDKTHAIIAVSKPSDNQLFPGYGVVKISSLDNRSSEYVSIHQNTIRDIGFNPRGDRLLLSASMDKSVKMTSMTSNTVVQSYNCPCPVWSCCWNDTNTNFFHAGLQNGQCFVFDVRKTNEALKSFHAMNGASCPVISMTYAPKCPGSDFSAEGLFICTLNGGCFWELSKDSHFISHPLSLSPGIFSGFAFDEISRCIMASYRPSKYHAGTRHLVHKMSGHGVDSSADNTLCRCTQTRQLIGGNISKVLSRAALFSFASDTDCLYAAAGDEASNSTLVWDCHTGTQLHKIPSSGIVLDIAALSLHGNHYLTTLTEKQLSIHRWE